MKVNVNMINFIKRLIKKDDLKNISYSPFTKRILSDQTEECPRRSYGDKVLKVTLYVLRL